MPEIFEVTISTGRVLDGLHWPAENAKANLCVQTGMAEYAKRYDHFAAWLAERGVNVWVLDTFGQGENAESPDVLEIWPVNAFTLNVDAIHQMDEMAKKNGLPTVQMGHSMGSFMVQSLIERYPLGTDKVIIMGSNGGQAGLMKLGYFLAKLMVNDLQVQAQGGMGYLPVTSCINTATVSNNELKLYRMNGELVATFSKATSLSGRWSGGMYTVTAKQGTKEVGTNRATIRQLSQSGGVGKINKYVGQTVSVYATENGGSNYVYTGFQQEIWIDASSVWQDGRDSAPTYNSSCRITCTGSSSSGPYTTYTYTATVNASQDAPTRTVGQTVTVHW